LPEPHPPAEKVESWRSTFLEWQAGHSNWLSASLIRRNISNTFPQRRHWYSYKGIPWISFEPGTSYCPTPFPIQASESAAQHRQSALSCIVNECRNGEKCYIRLSERTGFRGQKQHSPVAGKEGKRAHFPRAPTDWPKEILRRVVLLNYCFSV